MDISFLIKNKRKIIVGVIILLILLIGQSLVNSTYSLFYHEDTAANTDAYSTGLLSIIANSNSQYINLNNVLPMSDSEGEATTPYTFTIKNVGNLDYKFDVKLLSTASSDTTIDSRYIKVKVDDGTPVTLSSLTSSIIKSDVTLAGGESIEISIRVWLSIDTPNSQIGKVFNSKIVTDGQAIYTSSNKGVYDNYEGAAKTIANLFNPNEVVKNNDIKYKYDTEHNLMEDVGYNIRYYGASPNNYIYFNCDDYSNQTSDTCEIWRIIGVFDGKVKIMRGSSIGAFSWDNKNIASGSESSNGKNDWTTARLMKLLNPSSYYITDINDRGYGYSLYWNSESGTCFVEQGNQTIDCDFTNTGIKNDTTRNIISEANYVLLGAERNALYSNQIYDNERKLGTVYEGRQTFWKGKIAVLYASDYAYAANLNLCQRELYYFSDTNCILNNWILDIITNNKQNYGYLLDVNPKDASTVWYVRDNGAVNNEGNGAMYPREIVPTLYLEYNQDINSGDGTITNPYQLKVE